ncbi:hypothetical protein [Robbsia sp. KACC 23696]|uniref:hypothetical protein n=1 Tax=Robbsia sp. KACC 23696 TaxID=3149231 RepID=UPI00325ABF2B
MAGIPPALGCLAQIPPMIDARRDKIESASWKPMLKAGRAIALNIFYKTELLFLCKSYDDD